MQEQFTNQDLKLPAYMPSFESVSTDGTKYLSCFDPNGQSSAPIYTKIEHVDGRVEEWSLNGYALPEL